MVYLKKFKIPNDSTEIDIIWNEHKTCYNSEYPFKIFPLKQLEQLDFAPITIFYGSNGSGKTTLLNVIAEKLHAFRNSKFNTGPYFEKYVENCRAFTEKRPQSIQFLSSDDVFDYLLDIRHLNDGIDDRREELFEEYTYLKKHGDFNLHGIDDYDRWKTVSDAKSKKSSKSQFVRDRLVENVDMFSNGETAMRYFVEYIDKDSMYLLDEPESSLSISFQLDLARYISDSARFYNCQFVISTHSPIFLSIKGAMIYDLDSVPVTTCRWTKLENVRRYYEFFREHEAEFEDMM